MSVRKLLLAAVVVALVAPACSRGGDDDAYTLQLAGRAEIVSDGETNEVDEGIHRLSSGDVVRMLDGSAVLELPGDRSMLLRDGRDEREATVVDLGAVPEVVDGEAVVVAADAITFRVGGVEVGFDEGAARVQRALGVTVAMYAGTAEVHSAGRSLSGGLAALRQVSVPATGLLPREPSPLLYDDVDPDPWDRRFIGEAIDLGIDLDERARGFTGQLGARTSVDASLLRRVLPTLADERDFGDGLLDGDRSAGEALVGSAIVVESDGASFRERWDDVFAFRDDGARWGLVALDQQVKRDALLGAINDAFGRSPLLFAAPDIAVGGGVSLGTPTTQPPTSAPTAPTTTPGDGDDGDDEDPPTTLPPPTVPPLTIPPILPLDNGEERPDPSQTPDETQTGPTDVVREIVEDLLGDGASLLP